MATPTFKNVYRPRPRPAHHHGRQQQTQRPRQSHHPLHRRRRHRPRYLARSASASSTPPSPKPTTARRKSPGWKSTPAKKPSTNSKPAPPKATPRPGSPMTPSKPSAHFLVGIKGPLTTPVGGGIRSLNVALRQLLDLYVCLRPVRYFTGVPSPVKRPEKVDMVIFRENTEDIYAGIEWAAGTAGSQENPRLHQSRIPQNVQKDPLPRAPPASASRPSPKKAPPA